MSALGEEFYGIDLGDQRLNRRARRLLEVARDHDVLFVEEPLPAADLGGFRRLADGAAVTIATGEHLVRAREHRPPVGQRRRVQHQQLERGVGGRPADPQRRGIPCGRTAWPGGYVLVGWLATEPVGRSGVAALRQTADAVGY